ncbi:MAG: hypothetical protein ACOZNI_10780 [Myxococcota bacterium]
MFLPPAHAADLANVSIDAYVDVEHRTRTFGEPALDLEGFRQAHATLLTTAEPADDLLVHLRIETGYGGLSWNGEDNGEGDPVLGQGFVVVHAAYAQWTPKPWLRLRGGRLLTPWGKYNEIHDASPTYAAVHIPYAVYHPTLFGGFNSYEQVGTGLMATASTGRVSSTLMVTNGMVEIGNEAFRDDNVERGALVRVEVDPVLPLSGSVTASYSALGPYANEHLWAGIASVQAVGAGLTGLAEATVADRRGETQAGGMVEVSSTHLRRLTPFLRGETFVPDVTDPSPRFTVVGGAAVTVSTGHVLLKLDHVWYLAPEGSGEVRGAVVGWF